MLRRIKEIAIRIVAQFVCFSSSIFVTVNMINRLTLLPEYETTFYFRLLLLVKGAQP